MPSGTPYTESSLIDILRDFHEKTGEVSTTAFREDDLFPSADPYIERFGSWGNAVDAAGVPHGFMECPECGNLYGSMATHWRYNPDHRPEITERQHQILTGLLMGDGSISSGEGNTLIRCENITRPFLRWLKSEMGVLSKEVRPCSEDSFIWYTCKHPGFNRYASWYSSGRKRYPPDLELTPMILKVWFCGDGHKIVPEGRRVKLSIACSNEIDRPSFLKGLFHNLGVTPYVYEEEIVFDPDESQYLWDYMGDPLPGFEYKWPSEDDFEIDEEYWWSDCEEDILKEKYPEIGISVEDYLDRSRGAILGKVSRMGLTVE